MSGSRDKEEADAAAIAIEVEDDDGNKGGKKGSADDGGKSGSGEEKVAGKGKAKDEEEKPELSEEEQRLKDALDLAVVRIKDTDEGVAALALETMRKEIRSATSSMTSVPLPLKFLRPHYDNLVAFFEKSTKGKANTSALADILSVLAMTMGKPEERRSLKFKLKGNMTELGEWGHEYVRSIAGEIGAEFEARTTADPPVDAADLLRLVNVIVPFHMSHNAEHEAVDLLIEVESLPLLLEESTLDSQNYKRVCLYLLRTADYISDLDELLKTLRVAQTLYLREGAYVDALRVALRMRDNGLVAKGFKECGDEAVRKQMAYLLAVHRHHCLVFENEGEEIDEDERDEGLAYVKLSTGDADELNEIVSNAELSQTFAVSSKRFLCSTNNLACVPFVRFLSLFFCCSILHAQSYVLYMPMLTHCPGPISLFFSLSFFFFFA